MYVPASDSCNILGSQFGSASTATTSAFTIKVTQVECNSKTRAPDGCLQYFTGTTGTIETFNYNNLGGVLLTNQDYSACVRYAEAIIVILPLFLNPTDLKERCVQSATTQKPPALK